MNPPNDLTIARSGAIVEHTEAPSATPLPAGPPAQASTSVLETHQLQQPSLVAQSPYAVTGLKLRCAGVALLLVHVLLFMAVVVKLSSYADVSSQYASAWQSSHELMFLGVERERILEGCDAGVSGFNCQCNAGYESVDSGYTCTACAIGYYKEHSTTSGTASTSWLQCKCNSGFGMLPWKVCDNIDECDTDTHNCDHNAACTDTVGSFECACNAGYTGDGVMAVGDG
eukprot:CAMPEP_0175886738 /NCGR_PEP_ID=MMETSP0107_2-20121207/45797_1 /TAXON_ID=195067 ORGANISM="Goniomonas pacifica, Strain CCMP1869" /NCGR_SAMPLE_ID=MMETSP0107_2 /ASSEMBLY_ACC=CAM_ASM_000203 /LENGTH=227 /DNA_ID=CAMNT_0017207141 /DNA_START=18 /DNA_END=698 /DNA_ORIENTATION=+